MQDNKSTPLARVAVALLLALGLSATSGEAADRDGAFVIGPDPDAYRQSELVVLDAEVRAALAHAASADPNQIDSLVTEDAIFIFIREDARTLGIVASVQDYLASRPDVVLLISPVEVDRISFSQQLSTSAGVDSRMGRALYLEEVARDARSDPTGIDIRRGEGSIVVRISDPALRPEIAAALRKVFPSGGFLVRAMPDQSWRVTTDPAFFGLPAAEAAELRLDSNSELPSSATRQITPEAMKYALRDELREPRDLGTIPTPDGLVVLIPDPGRYPSFRTRLNQALSNHPDLAQNLSSARLLTIRRSAFAANAKATGGPASAETPNRLIGVWHEVGALIDPPAPRVETKLIPNGLEIQAADRAQDAQVAATIQRHFAGRPIVVETQIDRSLRVTFADGYLESKIPHSSVLADNVRDCMGAWDLSLARVSVVAKNRIEVVPARSDDASKLRNTAFTRCGFSMRLVDREAGADPAEPPPWPGDERFPQAQDELEHQNIASRGPDDLWLKPGAFITADMIAETRVGVDRIGRPNIGFKLTDEGRRRLAAMTTVNIDQRLAVVFDGLIVSAPRIMDQITAGQGEIAGNFTEESARTLANAMLVSRAQFPLKIVEVPGGSR